MTNVARGKAMRVHYRQGDVLVARVRSIPKGATKVSRDSGRIVLAYGEVTGHAHAIAETEVTMFEVDAGIRYLDVQMEAHLRHEEHATITLPPGKYRVVRQREYSPEEIRNVSD